MFSWRLGRNQEAHANEITRKVHALSCSGAEKFFVTGLPSAGAVGYLAVVAAKNIVYFDLETQRSFGDVGGFSNKGKMGISIAVTYSTARGTY